ncbi:MAG: 4-(cytidine 5'-diphospho)-2-C-methyl-D-erythritol kinase [Pirellulales bacterium]|nr:4-(cytidine 5'-diphospho)-2-C-methyl-D-erythritol kinase [Pirellulales bacterium]
MRVVRSAKGIVVQAPAKINLFFEVLGKRADGYHEVETLMCPVSLFDTIVFQESPPGPIHFHCRQTTRCGIRVEAGGGEVPEGPDNLAVRAVQLLRERAGVSDGGWLHLTKRIPMAAGLGGGSSDAAAALTAANVAWKLNWPSERLMPLAAELGSDVPFFLDGGAALCRGRGERVEPLDRFGLWDFVVIRPPAGLSTRDVYRRCVPPDQPRNVNPLRDALLRRDRRAAGREVFNRLQPAAARLSPWVDRLHAVLAAADGLGYGMSGSGTAHFVLCRHVGHARRLARRFQAMQVGRVYAVQSCR